MAHPIQTEKRVEPQERRKKTRYKACGGAFAILKFGDREEVAQILDISHAGIAFRYFANGNSPGGLSKLDISIQNDGLLVEHIPFQTVYDADFISSFSTASGGMRRLGARFDSLDEAILQQLDYFIHNYTFGLA